MSNNHCSHGRLFQINGLLRLRRYPGSIIINERCRHFLIAHLINAGIKLGLVDERNKESPWERSKKGYQICTRHLHIRSIPSIKEWSEKKKWESNVRNSHKSYYFIMEMIFIVVINVLERIYKWITYWITSSVDIGPDMTSNLFYKKNKINTGFVQGILKLMLV